MAKIMLVRCSPIAIDFIQSSRKFHVIAAKSNDEALRFLGQTSPDLLPDLVVIGNHPPFDFSRRRAKRAMIEFAGTVKRKFRRVRIVLANGRIFPKRAPDFVAGVCSASPTEVLAAIQRILSPTI